MKRLIIFIFTILFSSTCFSQNEEFSLIGNWQEVEYHGNDGATDYIQKVENGRIFIFEQNNVVKDKIRNIGSYELIGNNLHIVLPNAERFYRIYYENNNTKRLSLIPVTNKYEYICDEGCAEIFEKSDDEIEIKSRKIRGFVFDNSYFTNIPLPYTNATIEVKGTERKAISDIDGKFEIEAKVGDELIVSGIFTKKQIISVTDKNCYKINLNTTLLDYPIIMDRRTARITKRHFRKVERKIKDKMENGFYDCLD